MQQRLSTSHQMEYIKYTLLMSIHMSAFQMGKVDDRDTGSIVRRSPARTPTVELTARSKIEFIAR